MKDTIDVTHPDIAIEWDCNKNESQPCNFTYGSNKKIWWICPKGHEWETSINNRCRLGTCCLYCSGRKLCKENSLLSMYPNLSEEWSVRNNLTPKDVRHISSDRVWWECRTCDSEWEATISHRIVI